MASTESPPPTPAAPADRVPQAVRDAVNSFQPPSGFVLLPRQQNERSPIFSWGVRLATTDSDPSVFWICLASASCRQDLQLLRLSMGKTSRAALHLKTRHGHEPAYRVQNPHGASRKRDRPTVLATEDLRQSELFSTNPQRLYVLLEVLRIANNSLPIALGEFDESTMIQDLMLKSEAKAPVDEKAVAHAIVEIHAATRGEIRSILQESRIADRGVFSVVLDLRRGINGTTYVAIRLYFVDVDFVLRSVLLGVRHIVGLRHGDLREPFQRWIEDVLKDFGVKATDLFVATGASVSETAHIVTDSLKLPWVPTIPDQTLAVTKAACGMVGDSNKSENRALTGLIHRIIETVHQTKEAAIFGTLYLDLERSARAESTISDTSSGPQLTLTKLLEKVLDKWDALVAWYGEASIAARHEGRSAPVAFPLAYDNQTIKQLLSLLQPIIKVIQRSEGDQPNQVEVFVTILALRRSVLNTSAAIKDYQSTRTNPVYIPAADLTDIVASTRVLLRKQFDRTFFSQYTEPELIHKSSMIHEMQMLLHPKFKRSLETGFKEVVLMCNIDAGYPVEVAVRNFNTIKERIQDKLEELMGATAPPQVPSSSLSQSVPIYSEDIDDMVSMTSLSHAEDDHVARALQDLHNNMPQGRSTELITWLSDSSELEVEADGTPESVLTYWRRQSAARHKSKLCRAARILFGVPSSTFLINQDFAVAEKTVNVQPYGVPSYSIDMSIFLNANRNYVDISQCGKLNTASLANFIPTNLRRRFDQTDDASGTTELIKAYLSWTQV